jgi:membrane-bound ClpP family serine protease
MPDSNILDRKKKTNKNTKLGFLVMFVGMIFFIVNLLFLGNNFIVAIIGAVIFIIGISLLKKTNTLEEVNYGR